MNQQRKVIYSQRRDILKGEGLIEAIEGMIEEVVEDAVLNNTDSKVSQEEWNISALTDRIQSIFGLFPRFTKEEINTFTQDKLIERLKNEILHIYKQKEKDTDPEAFLFLQKIAMLQAVDELWMDHLLSMDRLKEGIGLRGYGQMDPLKEYQKEGYSMFISMVDNIKEYTLKTLFRIRLTIDEKPPPVRLPKRILY